MTLPYAHVSSRASMMHGAFAGLLDAESDYLLAREVTVTGQNLAGSMTFQANGPTVVKGNTQLYSLVFAEFLGPVNCTLALQADAPTGYLNVAGSVTATSAAQGVLARITYFIGAARFYRVVPVTARVRNVRLFCSSLHVEVWSEDNATYKVRGAVAPGETNPMGDVEPNWIPWQAAAGLANANLVVGPGCLLGISGGILTVLGTGDTNDYAMFFDLAPGDSPPGAGTIPLLTLGPLAAGTVFSFDASTRPDVEFSRGLYFQLSSTPVRFTVTGASAAAKFDFDWGQ